MPPLPIPRSRASIAAIGLLVAVGPAAGADAAPLVNGGAVAGTLLAGEVDTWEFSASAGHHVTLRVADTVGDTFDVQIELFDPLGAPIASEAGANIATIEHDAALTGTYTVEVSDSGGTDPGSYALQFAGIPGANELGALANDGVHADSITLGDLDTYTFTATAGEHVTLRIADLSDSSFTPRIEVYDPTGALVGAERGGVVATVEHAASATGTFSVLVRDDRFAGGGDNGVGDYELRFVRVPGAGEHGALANGGVHPESISVGDLDTYTFAAAAGDHVALRIAEIAGTNFTPRIELYGPSGARLDANGGSSSTVATIEHDAGVSGIFTVLVLDNRFGDTGTDNGSGDYELFFARIPGATEHGALANDGTHVESITLGDIDTYTFDAAAGQHVTLRIAETSGTNFDPRLELYDPSGAQVAANSSSVVATVEHDTLAGGTFTVLVRDDRRQGGNDDGFGSYELRFVRIPGAGEGGGLTDGAVVPDAIDLGDLDTFVFTAGAGASVTLEVEDFGATSLSPRIELYAPDGTLVDAATAPTLASIATTTPASGVYTVLVLDDSVQGGGDDGVGAYQLRFEGEPTVPVPLWALAVLGSGILICARRALAR